MNQSALIIGNYSWRSQNVLELAWKLAHLNLELFKKENHLK